MMKTTDTVNWGSITPANWQGLNPTTTPSTTQANTSNVGGWNANTPYTSDPNLKASDPAEWGQVRDFYTNMLQNGGGGGSFNYTPQNIDVLKLMQPLFAQSQTAMEDANKNTYEQSTKNGQLGSMNDWITAEQDRRMQEDLAAQIAPTMYTEADKERQLAFQAAQENASMQAGGFQRQLTAANALFGMGQQGYENTLSTANELGTEGQNLFNQENTLAQQYNNPAVYGEANQFLGTSGANTGTAQYQPNFWEQMAGIPWSQLAGKTTGNLWTGDSKGNLWTGD